MHNSDLKLKSLDTFETRSDVEELASIILKVAEVGRLHGIEVWLCYGALLGMIRENRLLPWNNDAELACWYIDGIEQKFKSMTDTLNGMGINTFYYSSIGSLSVRAKSGVIVNLNAFWKEGPYAVRPHETPSEPGYAPLGAQVFYWLATLMATYTSPCAGDFKTKMARRMKLKRLVVKIFRIIPMGLRKRLMVAFFRSSKWFGGDFCKTTIPNEYFEGFSHINFYGGEMLAPDCSDRLLEYLYGSEWRIPKDKWRFYSSENKEESGMKYINKPWAWEQLKIL